jgi:excisionase family DNA binding protein
VTPRDLQPAQPLIDADVAGALLSVPASWMLREARAGRIPHVRLGRYVRFDAAALDAWWRSRVAGPVVRTGSVPVSDRRAAQ